MTVRILLGDARARLSELPDESVHAVVTSPPYYGVRSYLPEGHPDKHIEIGLERTPDEYVAKLVAVFRECRRVLRKDGVMFVNIGDCYATGAGRVGDAPGGGKQGERFKTCGPARAQVPDGKNPNAGIPTFQPNRMPLPGLKPKDLIGIPWSVAFALRADGWWLRAENIWAKPNGMPESTRDRPTRAHEHVFQFSKSETYYFGYEDVRLPPVPESVSRLARAMRSQLDGGEAGFVISGGGYAPPGQPPHKGARRTDRQRRHSRRHNGFSDRWDAMSVAEQQSQGASLRSVWWIAPGGFDEAHYAVMPEALAATCVLASCPPGGTVLDPFGGAGTTAVVADRLGRNAVLIDLHPDYAAMAERRLHRDAGMFANVNVERLEAAE